MVSRVLAASVAFLAMASISYAQTITINGTFGTCISDVVFALDQSSSMTSGDFSTMKLFTVLILDEFTEYGPNGIQMGLLTFSDDSMIVFNTTTYSTIDDTRNGLLSPIFFGGMTNTHLALRDLLPMLQLTRPGVNKVAILITDGDATEPVPTEIAADALKASGVELVLIAIGRIRDVAALRGLASSPDLFVQIDDFSNLEDIRPLIRNLACGSECVNRTIELASLAATPATLPVLVAESVSVAVDPINAAPFVPSWSSVGCAANDTTIRNTTRVFADSTEVLLNATTSISQPERECYRTPLNNLKIELDRVFLDCPRIAKLTRCGVKVLRLMNDQNVGVLIQDGTNLANDWDRYTNASLTTSDPTQAQLIVDTQYTQVAALRQQLVSETDPVVRATLQQEINSINGLISLNEEKIAYSGTVTGLDAAFAGVPIDPTVINLLQQTAVTQLTQINSQSNVAQEQAASQTALTAMQTAVGLNGNYTTVVTQLTAEEAKLPSNATLVVGYQREVRDILTGMQAIATTQVISDNIEQVITPLASAINANDLIVTYLNVKPLVEAEQVRIPSDTAAILALQTQAGTQLEAIRDAVTDAGTKRAYQTEIDGLQVITNLNTAKSVHDSLRAEFVAESVVVPLVPVDVRDILIRAVAQLRLIRPLSTSGAEIVTIDQEIVDLEEDLRCF